MARRTKSKPAETETETQAPDAATTTDVNESAETDAAAPAAPDLNDVSPVDLDEQDPEGLRLRLFTVTKASGPRYNGVRVAADDELALTRQQGQHGVNTGALQPTGRFASEDDAPDAPAG